MKKNKKSQMEIIGVVIIVIILIVAGLFFLRARASKKVSTTDTFTDPKMAQSFLNTLMNTKTEKNIIVSDIIKDCYSNRNDLCGSTSTTNCCEYAYSTMTNALEATFGEWKRSYSLTIVRGTERKIKDIPENPDCTPDSEQEQPGIYYIPPPTPIVVTLRLCKN
jgi:hypothetical protein